MTCPSFIAAPFIVPSAATICSAVSICRRSRAFCLPSSSRPTFAAFVPICLAVCVAASRPTLEARRMRPVGMSCFSRAMGRRELGGSPRRSQHRGPDRNLRPLPALEPPPPTDRSRRLVVVVTDATTAHKVQRNGHRTEKRERVIVRFAGDSGDGMQLAGGRFTDATAAVGNDLATFPNFPAEIRAPAGTLAGVSSFQIHFAARDIATPGDTPNVLVAMNPAALKANLPQLEHGVSIIVNEDAFSKRNLQKAGYESSPLDDDSLAEFQVTRVPMTTLCQRATEAIEGATTRDAQKARNLFALGLVSWLYERPTDVTERWIEQKFAEAPHVRDVNLAAFRAGWNFGETTELIGARIHVAPATDVPPGTYRNVNGTQTTALGLIAASIKSGLPLTLAAYPITPASELLHDLARRRDLGVRTVQAEDEIAAAGIALGASYGGGLGVTATSGPGMDLKAETVGLAVALELPLVVIDVQRAGPSTGMPTKTEQSDLLMALYGRHGESPLPVIAASTPGGCFEAAFEAARIAIRYRTPVILLTDLFLANSSEPWRIPAAASLAAIDPAFIDPDRAFAPYARNADGARPWAVPGTPGAQHQIGGLEKADGTGEISYDATNHAQMTRLRA